MGDIGDLEEIAVVSRKPIGDYIQIDYSMILANYLRNNLSYTDSNVIFYYTTARVVVSGMIVELSTSVSQGTLGYTHYAQNGSGTFNQMDVLTDTGYVMNSQEQNTIYLIPYEHYELSLRNSLDFSNVVFTYTTNSSQSSGYTYTLPTGQTLATDEILPISCGYKDIVETYNQTDMDISLPYSVMFSGSTTGTTSITYQFGTEDYCDDELTTIQFLNKYGVWDFFYFTGKKDEELNYEYETYKHNNIDTTPTFFVAYTPEYGQYHKSFVQGKTKYILNTGWCDRIKNSKIEQLFLSEYVFDYNTRLPLIRTDKTIRYKTERYDKLIQYTINFDAAYDKINSIS
jgi:hypothetical protein